MQLSVENNWSLFLSLRKMCGPSFNITNVTLNAAAFLKASWALLLGDKLPDGCRR